MKKVKITSDGREAIQCSHGSYITRHDPPNYAPSPKGPIPACPRVKAARCPARIPQKWIEDLEQNQKVAACCRHPEHHEVEAFYSSENWKNKLDPYGRPDPTGGVPDIYIFYCTCGRQHVRFCVGGSRAPDGTVTHPRPYWEIR